jgi:hypothetical protein
MKKVRVLAALGMVLLLGGASLQASIVDALSTPDTSGIIAGDNGWGPNEDGYRVTWTISQNLDLTWHYKYEFSKANGDSLDKLTSHIIISLSDDIEESDLFNFGSDVQGWNFGTFGPAPGSPGFPTGESISGVKIDLWNDQTVVEFDSNRQPMWGDFYTKDGVSQGLWNYAYNTDLGVIVANPDDYMGTPVDAFNNELHKILVPDTIIPEPATICLLSLGAPALLRKRRA